MNTTGWFCSYTPLEIIHAANSLPIGIKHDTGAEHEDVLLGDAMCSYVRSCIGGALTNKLDYLDYAVITHSCECMRKLSDGWLYRQEEIKPKLIHVLDVPKIVSNSSIKFFANGLKRLKADLEKIFGEITKESLIKSIEKYNEARDLIFKIQELRKQKDTPVTGIEAEQIFSGFASKPVEEFNQLAKEFIELKKELSSKTDSPRVMIIGGPGNKSLISTIEKAGGLCVVENMCTAVRSIPNPITNEEDPVSYLAKLYLEKTPCPRMLGEKSRQAVNDATKLASDYSVDGVIYFSMKFCANMQMQSAHMKNDNIFNVPMKVIEGDISSEINEREVQSFIKRLKKRRKRQK